MSSPQALRRAIAPLAATSLLTLAAAPAQAGSVEMGDFTLTYSGYIKLDAFVSDYGDGAVATDNLGRVFYVPSTIPVGGEGEDPYLDMHARQTRFNIKTEGDVGGHKVTGTLELDFMVSPGGDERISNSWNPRVRHAFFTYDNWLFGQTWSNFQNPASLPDAVDFIGPTESVVFVRQAQIRYTMGALSFSAENRETTVTEPGQATNTTGDGYWPDLTARWVLAGGQLQLAALLRNLAYETTGFEDDTWGGAISATGKIAIGSGGNDIRYSVSYGSGMGRYYGLNLFRGALVEGNDLEAIDSYGGYLAYRHVWNSKARSNFVYGYSEADNEPGAGGGATKSAWSARANFIYAPLPKVDVGFEVSFAERETEDGTKGDLTRFQLGVKYAF